MDRVYLKDVIHIDDIAEKVWNANSKIRSQIFNDVYDKLKAKIQNDILDAFGRTSCFYFDSYDNPILNVFDCGTMLDGCHYLKENHYYFIPVEEQKTLSDMEQMIDILGHADEDSDIYTDAYTKAEAISRKLSDIICRHILCDIEDAYNDNILFEYFKENLGEIADMMNLLVDEDFICYRTEIISYE